MGERASIFQTVQIGVESIPGEPVAANKKLNSLSIEPSLKVEINKFRPAGVKYPTLTALGKEQVEAKLSGQPTFNEIIYPLSSVLTAASGSSLGGTPPAYQWTFTPSAVAADTYKTFTVEQGDASRAHKFDYGLVTGLSFSFSRSENSIEGTMIGSDFTDGVSLTASPSSVELVPVLPTQVTIYLDDAFADLGDTALTRPLSSKWEITDRFGPLWALNANFGSFAAIVETEPNLNATLKMEADAEGMALLNTMREGSTKFMRIEAVGETIGGENTYLLRIDTALKVTEISDFSDEDGVFAVEWTFTGVYDADWGKVCEIVVVNKQAAL